MALLIGAVLFVLLRRTTWPLKLLAQQAEQFGRGDAIPPLNETGPLEVTETLAAFNLVCSYALIVLCRIAPRCWPRFHMIYVPR